MSKKILKRSLALGALMAFVITGSAMAAENNLELTANDGKYVITNVDYTSNNYDNIILKNTNGHVLYTGTTTIVANKSITIDGSKFGILGYGKHTIQAPTITIIAGEDGIQIPTDSNSGKTTIKGFDLLNITSINGYAIVNNGENEQNGKTLEIIGNDGSVINLNSTERPALGSRAGAGNTSIKAGSLNVTGDGGNKYGAVFYVAKGTEMEIIVDNLTVENTGEEGNAIIIEDALAGVTVNETTVVNGDVEVKSGGDLDIDFNNERSVLNGSVKTEDGSNTKLNFNGGKWNVPEASNVSEITGDVNIQVAKIEEGFVTIGNTDELDQLTVSAENDGTNTEEDLAALSAAVVGANEEVLADQVQLKNAIYDNVVGDVTEDGVKIIEKEVAAANVSVNDMVAIGLMSWRAEMNDMNKRMGELRNANGEHGVWVRMVRGESEYNSVKNQYNQYQLGYDEKLSVDKRWTVGVALSYTDAENNFAQGNGESTNKALSIYGSKLNEDGTFIDLIAKYARLENDFTTYSGQGAGEYDANGSASVLNLANVFNKVMACGLNLK